MILMSELFTLDLDEFRLQQSQAILKVLSDTRLGCVSLALFSWARPQEILGVVPQVGGCLVDLGGTLSLRVFN